MSIIFCLAWQVGFQAIAEALGVAAVKAAVAITAIIAGGRLVRILIRFHPSILFILVILVILLLNP